MYNQVVGDSNCYTKHSKFFLKTDEINNLSFLFNGWLTLFELHSYI